MRAGIPYTGVPGRRVPPFLLLFEQFEWTADFDNVFISLKTITNGLILSLKNDRAKLIHQLSRDVVGFCKGTHQGMPHVCFFCLRCERITTEACIFLEYRVMCVCPPIGTKTRPGAVMQIRKKASCIIGFTIAERPHNDKQFHTSQLIENPFEGRSIKPFENNR